MTLKSILCAGMIGLAALGFSGCEKKIPSTIPMQSEELNQETLYSVKRVGVFEDNLAYDGKRGIYEITNNQTNEKYMGVSGIGITEIRSHTRGKAVIIDER